MAYPDVDMCVMKEVVISAGESISTVLSKAHYSYLSIHLPANWTTAAITFLSCDTPNGTFNQVVSATDVSEVNIPTVAASKVVVLDTEFLEALIALPFVKLRSGTLAGSVNQSTKVTIKIVLRR